MVIKFLVNHSCFNKLCYIMEKYTSVVRYSGGFMGKNKGEKNIVYDVENNFSGS